MRTLIADVRLEQTLLWVVEFELVYAGRTRWGYCCFQLA